MTSDDANRVSRPIAQSRPASDDASAGLSDRDVSRRMRRTTMLTAFLAISPLGIVAIAATSDSWLEAVLLSAGLLATLPLLSEWSIEGNTRRRYYYYVLFLAAIVWLPCALTGRGAFGFFSLSLAGAILLARLPRRRLLATAGFSLAVGLVGATVFLTSPPTWILAERFIAIPTVGTAFIAGVVMLSERSWLLVQRLERAKEAEAELAIARERMRFAGDLHDIQGHTLHVIKFKVTLAQRLLRTDTDRAEAELDEVRRLIGDTIERTRELAYAQHKLNITAELENARLLCEAAGIEVHIEQSSDPGTPAHPLLARVLREATTNLLRHARPTTVSITASPTRVEITNDGTFDDATPTLRGLERLRELIRVAGGELHIARSPGQFTVSAELSARSGATAAAPPVTTSPEEKR